MSAARRVTTCALLLLCLMLVACVGGTLPEERESPISYVELTATPFYAQARHQCGPAALATVLSASGVAVTPDALTPAIYLPGRRGSMQTEILAATRAHGRVPYVLRPNLQTLYDEVTAGTPVLVLLNLGFKAVPRWHYAVVIGYDTQAGVVLLRSGVEKRVRMSHRRFVTSWARAGNWAMVATPPEEIPVTAQSTDWLHSVSAFEELGQPLPAVAAYEAATERWPKQPLAWQALANAHYTLGNVDGAETALRTALRLSQSAGTENNLAQVLLRRGCRDAALASITRAEAAGDARAISAVLARTRAEIEASANSDAAVCPL